MSKKKNRNQEEETYNSEMEQHLVIFKGGPIDGQRLSFFAPVSQQSSTPTTISPQDSPSPYIWQHTKYIDDEYEPRVETLYSYFDKKDFS